MRTPPLLPTRGPLAARRPAARAPRSAGPTIQPRWRAAALARLLPRRLALSPLAAALASAVVLAGCDEPMTGPEAQARAQEATNGVPATPAEALSAAGEGGTASELAVSALTSLNRWQASPRMRTGRVDLVAATTEGRIYAIGGRNDHFGVYSSVEAFAPTLIRDGLPLGGSWLSKAPLPARRWGASGAQTINGKIYVPGGSASPYCSCEARPISYENTLFVYDPVTNAWAPKAPLPVKTFAGTSAAISGKLYVLTPAFVNGRPMLHRYDPATDRWTELASPPNDHSRSVGGVINGKFHVVGGEFAGREPNFGQASATLDVYDPATNRWTTKAAMPTRRYAAAGRVINNKFVVVGGLASWDTNIPLNTVEIYDPAANRWATGAPMPTARYLLAVAQLKGFLYALGGWAPGADPSTGLSTNEAYAP